jgi:hypothetical protein
MSVDSTYLLVLGFGGLCTGLGSLDLLAENGESLDMSAEFARQAVGPSSSSLHSSPPTTRSRERSYSLP